MGRSKSPNSCTAATIVSLPLVFRAMAQAELDEAAQWYDKRGSTLGTELLAEVLKVLGKISDQPDRYPLVSGDAREAPVQRFPYCVYYRVRGARVVVIAIFHTARDPSIWQRRV